MKTVVLHSVNDVDKLIDAALAEFPPPPALPNLLSVSSSPPKTQYEREEEVEQIKQFFSEHPEVFTFASRVSSYLRRINELQTEDFLSVIAPTIAQDELDSLVESAQTIINKRVQDILDRYTAKLDSFTAKLNALKSRADTT